MTLLYIMQAKENYDDAIAAQFAVSDPYWAAKVTQDYTGILYDHVRRKLIYSVGYVPDNVRENDTGHTLWTGQYSIAPGPDDIDTGQNLNHFIVEKSIDTGAVTFHDCYDPASLVPNGIGGSDGTWRRSTDCNYASGNSPIIVDPRTGNVWQHADSSILADVACTIYLFRRSDSFGQVISPLMPPEGQSGHMDLECISDDWVYVILENNQASNFHVLLTPRTIQPEETAADYLLSFAEFDVPTLFNGYYFRFVMDHANAMYVFGGAQSGARAYKLYKFTEPSSAPYGGPTVGGGFADITPWAAGTGPNTSVDAYTDNGGNATGRTNKNLAMFLPLTNELALVTKLLARDTGAGVTDPLLTRFDCTYVQLGGGTFDYHAAFVTGYMKADWTPTSEPALAAWAVQDCRETNLYLGQNSYNFADVDYTKRWFFFTVQPVVAGVWTPNAANNHVIMVEYQFVSGAAPAVTRMFDESHWDAAYADYGADIGNANVVQASLADFLGDLHVGDCGVWDAETSSWWWSGRSTAMYHLDATFTNRAAYSRVTQPLLRIRFADFIPPAPVAAGVTVALIPMRVGVPQ